MKKFFSVLLSVMLVLNVLTPLAFAISGVNGSGTNAEPYLITDEVQFKDAVAEGGGLKLENDISLSSSVTVESGKSIVIDLNGNTLSYTSSTLGESMISNKGTLVITDSSADESGVIAYTFNGTPDTSFGKGNYTITNSGTLTVEAGTVRMDSDPAAMSHMRDAIDNNSTAGDAVLILNGGSIICEGYIAIRQFANSSVHKNSVTVNGGTVLGGERAIWIQLPGADASKEMNAELVVTGGTLTSTDTDYNLAVYVYSYGNSSANTVVDISGGTWNGDVAFNGKASTNLSEDKISVSGGTFNGEYGVYGYGDISFGFISGGSFVADVSEYCVDGFSVEQKPDGSFGVYEDGVIVFNANGGIGTMESIEIGIGSSVKLPKVKFTKDGYAFSGWATSDSGRAIYADEGEIVPESSMTLYAVWNYIVEVRHIISFDTNGGTSIRDIHVKDGTKLILPVDPVKDGYVFDGWYTDKALSVKYNEESSVTGGLTLYAKWISGEEAYKNPFIDVDTDDAFYEAVKFVYSKGLMIGMEENKFGPSDSISRAMIVTILYRAEGSPAVSSDCRFTDVIGDAYYRDAVIWAEENGIVFGVSDTEFDPNTDITKEQLAAIVYRYLDSKDALTDTEADLECTDAEKVSEYAKTAVAYMLENDYMAVERAGMFDPKADALRCVAAEVFYMLYAER